MKKTGPHILKTRLFMRQQHLRQLGFITETGTRNGKTTQHTQNKMNQNEREFYEANKKRLKFKNNNFIGMKQNIYTSTFNI